MSSEPRPSPGSPSATVELGPVFFLLVIKLLCSKCGLVGTSVFSFGNQATFVASVGWPRWCISGGNSSHLLQKLKEKTLVGMVGANERSNPCEKCAILA